MTLVPIFALGILMFYRPFSLRKDWPLLIAVTAMLGVPSFSTCSFSM